MYRRCQRTVAKALVSQITTRLAFRAAFNALRRRGFNLKTILVIGAGELGRRVVETIELHRELGFMVSGLLTRRPEKVGTRVLGVPVLGLYEEVGAVLDRTPVDQVILALPLEEQGLLKVIMAELAQRTVDVKVVPDLFSYVTLRGGLEEFGGLPIISLQGAPLEGWNRVLKRTFDVLVSGLALVLGSPVLLLVALSVKLASRRLMTPGAPPSAPGSDAPRSTSCPSSGTCSRAR